ncbi:ABC transporter substrate-binding protein, partial [Streptomyces noursei]
MEPAPELLPYPVPRGIALHRRPLCALALLPVLALAATACAGGGSPSEKPGEVTTVRVAHVPSTLFAPLYLADAKGYFKEQGLQVELTKVQAGQDA